MLATSKLPKASMLVICWLVVNGLLRNEFCAGASLFSVKGNSMTTKFDHAKAKANTVASTKNHINFMMNMLNKLRNAHQTTDSAVLAENPTLGTRLKTGGRDHADSTTVSPRVQSTRTASSNETEMTVNNRRIPTTNLTAGNTTASNASALGPCAEERQRLEALKKRFGNRLRHLVIPECDAQGYYAPFRCGRTGCWCVDREGNRLLEGSNTPEECEALRGSENDI